MTRGEKKFVIIFSAALGYILLMVLIIVFYAAMKKKANPSNYYNVKWVSTNPEIELVVESKEYYKENSSIKKGYLIANGKEYKVTWSFKNYRKVINIVNDEIESNGQVFINGSYSLGSDYSTLTVSIKRDYIFDNEYQTLTFKKVEMGE